MASQANQALGIVSGELGNINTKVGILNVNTGETVTATRTAIDKLTDTVDSSANAFSEIFATINRIVTLSSSDPEKAAEEGGVLAAIHFRQGALNMESFLDGFNKGLRATIVAEQNNPAPARGVGIGRSE